MSKRAGQFERRERDFYPTPPSAVAPLLAHLPADFSYIEPCAGDGALARALGWNRCAFAGDVVPAGQDVSRAGAVVARQDGFDIGWAARCADYIITNPPWARDVLHRMIACFSDLLPTWLLFDADWMHTRQAVPFLWRLRRVVSVGRVKWIPDSPHTGKDNCAWHLFDATGTGPAEFFGRAG